jgi:hypothetical protein
MSIYFAIPMLHRGVRRRRGGLPPPRSSPRRFDCIEAEYAVEEKGTHAELTAPFVSPASWGSSPKMRRQPCRGRRLIVSSAPRWIEGDRRRGGRRSQSSSLLLFERERNTDLVSAGVRTSTISTAAMRLLL